MCSTVWLYLWECVRVCVCVYLCECVRCEVYFMYIQNVGEVHKVYTICRHYEFKINDVIKREI